MGAESGKGTESANGIGAATGGATGGGSGAFAFAAGFGSAFGSFFWAGGGEGVSFSPLIADASVYGYPSKPRASASSSTRRTPGLSRLLYWMTMGVSFTSM